MSVLVNDDFAASVSGWTVDSGSFSHVASEGSDFATGYASLAVSSQVTRTFTAVNSGKLRLTFWWKDAGTTVATTANTFIYVLPDSTVTSANGAVTLALARNNNGTDTLATTDEYHLTYRNSSTFAALLLMRRETWAKVEVILDIAARTYDVLINDVLYQRGVACANASFTSVDRVVILNQASGSATHIDNVQIESAWANGESVIIDHTYVGGTGEIEDSVPTTDTRNPDPQKYVIPTASGWGAFSLGANGATPDASALCLALQKCRADGIPEVEWKSSVSGHVYMGIMFRFWDYPSATGAGAGIFRISGGATNNAILQLPDATGVLTTVQTIALTPSANTIYTLKVEMRGRYLICSYKASARDSGSYTVAFTHQVTNSATGGRGMLSEEYCGPFIATTIGAADNYVRRFTFTGKVSTVEHVAIVGETKYVVDAGSIRHLANVSSGGGNQNVFHSKGIQFSHRSRADGAFAARDRTLFDLAHCKAYEQRVNHMTEYQWMAEGRPYVTLLRRGPWIADHMRPFDMTAYSENFAPDLDLSGRYFASGYRYIGATGASASGANTGAHDWTADASNQAMPCGYQKVTDFASGEEIRLTQIVDSASAATDTMTPDLFTKWEQTGDPVSLAISDDAGNLTEGTNYTVLRAFYLQQGSALGLDAATIERVRDDLKTIATFSYTTGSNKTNASGDYNSDGFNERHGWYEINASGNSIAFTFTVGGISREYPVFRVWGLDATGLVLTAGGTPLVSGTDYVMEAMGDGNTLIQILSTVASNTAYGLQAAASGGGPRVFRHHYQQQGMC